MKRKHVFTVAIALLFLVIVVLAITFQSGRAAKPETIEKEEVAQVPIASAVLFGIALDTFEVFTDTIKPGDTFGKIVGQAGLGTSQIFNVANKIDTVFDVRNIKAGHVVKLLKGKNSTSPSYFIYEASVLKYYLVHLTDSVYAQKRMRKRTVVQKVVRGPINSSLYQTLADHNVSTALTMKLANIYAWSIDFFRIQAGDSINVLFEDVYVDDTIYAGTGNILAARFYHRNKPYFAIRYTDSSGTTSYYDNEGNSLRRAFLKAPLKYSRISSRYTMRRFHPVQRRWKAHLGTDYAAPRGTPIMTTADGEIERAGYTSGNGNYVKVRHNSTYSTQYLHMSKIAKGIKPGVSVSQGDVIGYVGSTGLATGPHVCYRFWVNGKQVDPFKQELPNDEPINPKYLKSFLVEAEKRINQLNEG